MKLAIIIVTWNGITLTKRCLESLQLDTLAPETDVIVIDNGSSDGTVEYLEAIQRIRVIKNKSNLGYAKAVNLGITQANPSADILLLNNDVQILDSNWLNQLQQHAKAHPQHGVIGVKILQDNGRLQHCGAFLPLDTYWGQQLASGEYDIGQYSGINPCESVVFACAYIPRHALNAIGLLDEQFFAYFEDTDYCLRAKALGFEIALLGDVRIIHSENSSTKVNKVSHRKIFIESQKKFRDKWGANLEKNRYHRGSIDFLSILNFPSGYAASARSMVEHLDRQGFEISYQYAYGPGTVFPIPEPVGSESYIANMITKRPFGRAQTQIVYAQGDVFERNTAQNKIGYTMLEVDGLPKEWVRQANLMDEIWVPSAFNRDSFRQSGVNRPIHVMPLGVDTHYFSPNIVGWKPKNYFSFLSIFEWGERKAPELLLRAFTDEFHAHEDVVLICKINNFDPGLNIYQEIKKLKLRANSAKIVIANNYILQRYELGTIYRSADCFVLPTRGEGWGMPILEAMACGLPVIATNWGAQMDFINPGNALPLEVEKLIPAVAKCPYYTGFQWAEPSYEHLRHLMRWVFEHQTDAKIIGQKAASDAKNHWSWQHATQKMANRLIEFN